MKRFPSGIALAALFLLGASRAQSSVVFSQTPDNYAGYYSDIPNQQIADDFTLGSTATITSLHWWGGFNGPVFSNDFTLRLFNDDGSGTPNTNPALTLGFSNLTVTDTGNVNTGLGNEVLYYTADLTTPFTATGGVKYHLSILNGTSYDWVWEDQDRANEVSYRYGDGSSWSTAPIGNRAFELVAGTPAVPEPGTYAILASLGLTGAAFLRRRKR